MQDGKAITSAQVPGAVFGSNPCRVRHGTQELVFFRGDLEARMRRQCLLPPRGEPLLLWSSLSQRLLHLALWSLRSGGSSC